MVSCILILAVLYATGNLLARTPFYVRILQAPTPRFAALDGLRGFLALAVFVHHAQLTHHLIQTGVWSGYSSFDDFLGRVGVACFFSITGLLFWDKVLRVDGRLDVLTLYRSRIRRIVPMYSFSVVCVLLAVAWLSHFAGRVPIGALADSIGAWAAFGLQGFPDINGVSQTRLIAGGVHWTLTYEWAFYLALPFLALCRRPLSFAILLCGSSFFLIHLAGYRAIVYFQVGMIVATALRYRTPPAVLRHPAAALVALGFLAVCARGIQDERVGATGVLAMAGFFAIVASGNTIGGLLSSVPARFLGVISYSLYLNQGFVLFVSRSLLPWKYAGPALLWGVEVTCGIALVLASAVTYWQIEHPFLAARSAVPIGPSQPMMDVNEAQRGLAAPPMGVGSDGA